MNLIDKRSNRIPKEEVLLRNQKKAAFVKEHAEEIKSFIGLGKSVKRQLFLKFARKEIGYSESYVDVDLFRSLTRSLENQNQST